MIAWFHQRDDVETRGVDVARGQTRTACLVRPYRATRPICRRCARNDWEKESRDAKDEWAPLLKKASCPRIPDPRVEQAFYGCLGDCFIMREPTPRRAHCRPPGTDGSSRLKPMRAGHHFHRPRTNWACTRKRPAVTRSVSTRKAKTALGRPARLGASDVAGSGFKSWTAIEHYKLSRDRAYLEAVYPRMLASSRFNERQRTRTRVMKDGARPLTYGLMPRHGRLRSQNGDESLMACSAPQFLGGLWGRRDARSRTDPRKKQTTSRNSRQSWKPHGKIYFKRWTKALFRPHRPSAALPLDPRRARQKSGSRWGALNALTPCRSFTGPRTHQRHIRYIESNMSPGGCR